LTDNSSDTLSVLGTGSWGTALAILLARNGFAIRLWGHDPEFVADLERDRCNKVFLPDVPFPSGIHPVADLQAAIEGAADVILVVPSHAFREVLTKTVPFLSAGTGVCWATKGLETGSGKLLHQVAREVTQHTEIAVLSGPTFAREVAAGLPTAATVAAGMMEIAQRFASYFHGETFRVYTCNDMAGLELGGSTKNVLAIAAGISDGLGFGCNARAALITRGLAEMIRLGTSLGAHRETFDGLAGVGDLVLTCTDNQSRNRRFGLALGAGKTREQAEEEISQVIEGIDTAGEIYHLSQKHGIEMPITEQVYRVIYENQSPREAGHALLAREQKAESV
jgi:glycerol-3-phosphate dehydrogenase (NAD(P)+)